MPASGGSRFATCTPSFLSPREPLELLLRDYLQPHIPCPLGEQIGVYLKEMVKVLDVIRQSFSDIIFADD